MMTSDDALKNAISPPESESAKAAFTSYAGAARREIDRAISLYFDALDGEQAQLSMNADLAPVLAALRALVERGGKRLRGVFLTAAYEACGGESRAAIVPALVSFELLQGYLLVHDDWIDEDDVRRGGPTVHAALGKTFETKREAEIFAVLAGDFASALSLGALCDCAVPEARIARATKAMATLLRNVVLGQMFDVRGTVQRQTDDYRAAIDRVYELKTASYTVTGPLAIGAILAGASDSQVAQLHAVARPLGIMFQLRDDLLGVFGDPSVTGKSDSSDLRQGKFTALIVEAAGDPKVVAELTLLQRAHASGTSDADLDALVSSLRQRIVASGAKIRMEQRISDLFREAERAIESAQLTRRGKQLLLGAAEVIGGRNQ
ncbi:MAG: polyprenyl synthetase family protein [Polyangiaceae bacterium]